MLMVLIMRSCETTGWKCDPTLLKQHSEIKLTGLNELNDKRRQGSYSFSTQRHKGKRLRFSGSPGP